MADVGIKLSATDNTKAAFDSVGRNLSNIQTAASSVAGALASIGVGVSVGAFVTMTKQIIDGLDAMNDLKDATGASIENISALESVARRTGGNIDTVSTSLIKFNQALASTSKPGSDAENVLKAIGLSASELKKIDPAEALRLTAIALSNFSDDGNKARAVQELFGKSLKEVAPYLKDLAEAGSLNATVTAKQAEEAERFNKELFNLQANAQDAARAIASPLITGLNTLAERFRTGAKDGEGFLSTLVKIGGIGLNPAAQLSNFVRNFLPDGNKPSNGYADTKKEIENINIALNSLNLAEGERNGLLRQRLEAETRLSNYLNSTAGAGRGVSGYGDLAKGSLVLPDPKVKSVTRETGNAFAAEQDAAKEFAKVYEAAGKTRDDLIAKNLGLSKSEDELKRYMESTAAAINEKTNPAINDLVKAALQANIALEAEAKATEVISRANQAAFEAREKYVATLSTGLEQLQQETIAQQEYIDGLTMSKLEMAALSAEKLESKAIALDLIAIKQLERTEDVELYELYKKQSAELRKQAALKMQGSVKEAQLEIEKEITAERNRGWEETDRISREVFTSWATEGGNAAQKIGDTLKKALLSAVYEATLKPLVFQVYSSIAGGGGAGAALQAAGGGGGGNILSGLSNVFGNAAGLFGAGFKAGFGSVFGEAGTLGGLSAGTTAIGAGNLAGGLGTLAGTAAPFIAGLALLKSLTDYKVDSRGSGLTATVGGASGLPSGSVGMFNEFQQTGGLGGGGTTINRDWSVADQGVANYIAANVKNITATNKAYADALGLTSGSIESFTKSIEINTTGLDAAAQKAAIDGELAKFSAEQITAAYGDALKGVAKEGETTAQTLQRLGTDLTGINGAFGALGSTLFDVSVAGANAASTLASAFGGLAAAQAQLGSFYQNFYSQTEQEANIYSTVQADLQKAGITYSVDQLRAATRGDIRAAVDGLSGNTSTEQGAAQYAAAVKAANALAGIKTATGPVASDAPVQQAGGGGSSSGGGSGSAPVQDSALTAWEEATQAIVDAMRDLRVTLLDSGPDSFAKLQAQFVIETASAKAGNVAAREELPNLVKTLADASKNQFTSGVQRDLFIARLIETLGDVAGAGGAGGKLSIPRFAAGGYHSGGWAMVGEQGPELVNMPSARVFNAGDTRALLGGGADPALLEEMRAMRAELAAIRASSGSTAISTGKAARVLDAASNNGQPLSTKVVA